MMPASHHRSIGIGFIALSLVAATVGMLLSLVMRLQLADPGVGLGWLQPLFPAGIQGGVLLPEFYLSLVTMHGTIMVFFVLTLAPQAGFGHALLPAQIGADGMAYPRGSTASLALACVAFVVLLAAFVVEGGAPLSGWTAYPPLSALGDIVGPGQGGGMTLWIASIGLFCVAAVVNAVNVLVTTLTRRTAGMTMMRLPLTVWAWFTTALLSALAFPVLLLAAVLLVMDRSLGTSFFVPSGLVVAEQALDHRGGSPLLWQHLFWYFGHPEVYIAILPAMGVTSQVLSTFAGRPVFGYRAMVLSTLAIGGLGFFVWGHHMFLSGISPYSAIAFSLVTLTVGVPSALKTFNWLGTLWRGHLRFTTPMLFAIGFVSVFVTGGLTGIFLGQTSLDLYLHDTYFVVGHFHLIMGVAAVFGLFAATYYWWPALFGFRLGEGLGRAHFALTFLGVHGIFVPMLAMGMVGAPRRYYDFSDYAFLERIATWNEGVTVAAGVTLAAQLVFLVNLLWSRARARRDAADPWDAGTLEWQDPAAPAVARRIATPPTLPAGIVWIPLSMFFLALISALLVRRGLGSEWNTVYVSGFHWAAVGVLAASSLLLAAGRSTRLVAVLGALAVVDLVPVWAQLIQAGFTLRTSAHAAFYYLGTLACAALIGWALGVLVRAGRRSTAVLHWHLTVALTGATLLVLGVAQ